MTVWASLISIYWDQVFTSATNKLRHFLPRTFLFVILSYAREFARTDYTQTHTVERVR